MHEKLEKTRQQRRELIVEAMKHENLAARINLATSEIHELNKDFWLDLETGSFRERNFGETLMLIVSELAEAMEGDRKGLQDDKLPHRQMREVELADAVIRIFDLAGGLGMDLGGAIMEKLEFNVHRKDHKIAHRKAPGGKKY